MHILRIVRNPPSGMSLIKSRIKTLKFDARILRRELPVHLGMNLVAAHLPCSNPRT